MPDLRLVPNCGAALLCDYLSYEHERARVAIMNALGPDTVLKNEREAELRAWRDVAPKFLIPEPTE